MHCAPFLLTMQIIFASVSYRRVVADLRVKCIENLQKGIFMRYQTQQIMGAVRNLIYIIGRCTSLDLDNSALYKTIGMMWNLDYQRFEIKNYLDMVIATHNPTPEFALKFLYKVLNEKNRHNYSDIVNNLCQVISKSNLRIENIEHYISEGIDDFNMLPLYSITPDKDKPKLIEYGKTSFKECWFPVYVEVMHKTQTVPDSVEDFEKRLNKGKNSIESNNAIACKYMAEWRKDERYKSLWNIIDNYREKDDCLQFFSDPINYAYPEKVNIDWIATCSSDVVKKLIIKTAYSEKLNNYISDVRISPQFRRILMSVFKHE